MGKPFDATLNALIDLRAEDWAATFARLAGLPPGPSVALDTDLATTLQADKLFRIEGPPASILHLELEANPRTGIPRELMRYNTLVDHQHDLPVSTILVLLRPKALASDQTGIYERFAHDGSRIAEFRYRIEKVWERSVDFWLGAGVGLAPLAMATDESNADMESALDRFRANLKATGIEGTLAKDLVSSTYFLCGLRNNKEEVKLLFRRMNMLMEASSTYQDVLSQGGLEATRRLLTKQATKRFGPPSAEVNRTFQDITDPDRLERIGEQVFEATSWDDLLAVQ